MNNSSREKQQDTLGQIIKQTPRLRRTKYNLSFGQNRGIQKKLVATINRMPHNRLPSIIKNYSAKGRRKPGETIKETFRCVKPEQINKWPNSMVAG